MRRTCLLIVIGLLVAACGGGDGGDDGDSNAEASGGGLDPCALATDSMLISYFGNATIEGETSEAGPIDSCRWRDANANSLLIQVAVDHPLTRLDGCDMCVDLTFGDDGYASPSPFQSTATFVVGNNWYSVTTTGFGDDADAIAALAVMVFDAASE
ncbi:MAG: hypothetical protein HKN95_07160 [Acidimicrobiia bacterium]|nr:hypothetical protein [Acidimicrobiia bacterium]